MMSSGLQVFAKTIIDSIKKDHNGENVTDYDWSGFAEVTREGGKILYSASLKREGTLDPVYIKPAYQKQPTTGFKLLSVETILARFGDAETYINRIQLLYQKLNESEIKREIDRLNLLLEDLEIEECRKSARFAMNNPEELIVTTVEQQPNVTE